MPTWETLPGALSHHSPCSEKLHWESGEIARLGRMEDGRREKEQYVPEGEEQWPCLLPGELESL